MRRILFIAIVLFMGLSWMTCVEPFDPPEIANPELIMVIEGTLDAPEGKATVRLSYIRNINSPAADSLSAAISNALVQVLVNGVPHNIPETSPGLYTAIVPANAGESAQLFIQVGAKTYQSEEVVIKPVPEIDSVTFSADALGISIEVTTHDPANNTKYYQWSYEETAQYRSQFGSDYYYDGMNVYQRTEDQLLNCWKSMKSSNIQVATTDGLTEDLVFKYPLIYLPADSWKKDITYSALIRQYSITKETYVFLRELENNTENVGSLFDPQPGRIFGNFTEVSDPQEYIIGQFSARSVTETRYFLRKTDLPISYPPASNGCSFSDLDTISVGALDSLNVPKMLAGTVTNMMGFVIGYTFSRPSCMDCRVLRDGTNVRPDFWE